MSNKRSLEKIEKGISTGTYKIIRLLKIDEGKERTIYTWNKAGDQKAKERFEFIKSKLSDLEPGKYEIECGISHTSGIKERFDIEISEKRSLPINRIKTSKEEQGSDETTNIKLDPMPNEVDFDDYVALIKEVEKLKAQNSVLLTQIEMMQNKPLSDPAPANGIGSVIADNLPMALNLLEQFMGQREKQLNLEERKISLSENGSAKKNGFIKVKTKANSMTNQKSKEEILYDMENLYNTDPDSFNATLDEMEKKDPNLFNYIYEKMGLEDEGEELEEETTE